MSDDPIARPALPQFSVLVLYPEQLRHAHDDDLQTYYAFVEAPDARQAMRAAQRQALNAQSNLDRTGLKLTSFRVLGAWDDFVTMHHPELGRLRAETQTVMPL